MPCAASPTSARRRHDCGDFGDPCPSGATKWSSLAEGARSRHRCQRRDGLRGRDASLRLDALTRQLGEAADLFWVTAVAAGAVLREGRVKIVSRCITLPCVCARNQRKTTGNCWKSVRNYGRLPNFGHKRNRPANPRERVRSTGATRTTLATRTGGAFLAVNGSGTQGNGAKKADVRRVVRHAFQRHGHRSR